MVLVISVALVISMNAEIWLIMVVWGESVDKISRANKDKNPYLISSSGRRV